MWVLSLVSLESPQRGAEGVTTGDTSTSPSTGAGIQLPPEAELPGDIGCIGTFIQFLAIIQQTRNNNDGPGLSKE